MQTLGIEIRKANNIQNLYKDVDVVLQQSNITPNSSVSVKVQTQAIAHSLQTMLKVGRHFSVCTIDNCAKVAQIHISAERKAIYSSIHCMNWDEMLPDFRQTITAMILDDFRSVLNPQ